MSSCQSPHHGFGSRGTVAANEEWFSRQDAADVAVLAGVFTDKSIRILEALESAGPADPEGADVDAAAPPGAA